MKKKSHSGTIFVLLIIASFVGWKYFSQQGMHEDYGQEQDKIYVAFSANDEFSELMDYREIADYSSVYSSYNSRLMYNTMTHSEQQIYRFFEYAMDHECTTMFFDSRLLADVELSLSDILNLYSMDTPMVQQNFSYGSNEIELTEFGVTGTKFIVENFDTASMVKKKLAITAAKAVFQSMPEGLSQLEQARFFFRYLTRNVEYYRTEISAGEQHNLYDAFYTKKTQCDGFSNAFSLLCAMAKVPCVEKVTIHVENEIDHTWNVFCADGVWYNADLALSEDYARTHQEFDMDFSFGFSDSRNERAIIHAERFPKCSVDLLPVELAVASASDPKLLSGLKAAFQQSGKRFVLVSLDSGELAPADFQKIANHLKLNIRTLNESRGGKQCYYIFKK